MRLAKSLFLAFLQLSSTIGTHYGNPYDGSCLDDELAIRIAGIPGALCSPSCDGYSCPQDVPDDVTAVPACILQSPKGKYCALACSDEEFCGDAECQIVNGGMGICTYKLTETNVTLLRNIF